MRRKYHPRIAACYSWLDTRPDLIPDSNLLDWIDCPAVERDEQRVSGALVFQGTRVPVMALFENLADGVSTAEFVDLFPGVTAEQIRVVLLQVARKIFVSLAA